MKSIWILFGTTDNEFYVERPETWVVKVFGSEEKSVSYKKELEKYIEENLNKCYQYCGLDELWRPNTTYYINERYIQE